MVKKSVAIIDYGVGNLLSVHRALEACGASVKIVSTPQEILDSDRLILPGVGAFGNCMDELKKRELEQPILGFIQTGKPLLGICVGMQILHEIGEEFGEHRGLGIIPGRVNKISSSNLSQIRKVPFVGWAPLISNHFGSSILHNINPDSFFYFVHSFKAETKSPQHTMACYDYDGLKITAMVHKDNVIGCQFHPEKSGKSGLKILDNFLTQD